MSLRYLFPALLLSVATAGCVDSSEPERGEVEQAGTSFQGTSFQGTSFQGTSFQGTSFQGTSFQGATLGGVAIGELTISGTALVVKTSSPDLTWVKRLPDRICTGSSDPREPPHPCYPKINAATTPSPLTGVELMATFTIKGKPVAVPLIIGGAPTALGAVMSDTATAMFALNGSSAAACSLDTSDASCGTPGGCRTNCDVWLYDLRFRDKYDAVTGQRIAFCPAGERAMALAGTWDALGTFTPSSTKFTFTCTNGTIAKCTRWGYRPWGTSLMSDGTTVANLAPYHQACVRAAAAAYCGTASATSYTTNGTLVDVYDYGEPLYGSQTVGLIPRTRSIHPEAKAFAWESGFDSVGAFAVDHTRHSEITGYADPNTACPGRFDLNPPSFDALFSTWTRTTSVGSWTQGPSVFIASTGGCAHSDLMPGRWLHPECSACASKVFDYQRNAVTGVRPFEHCGTASGSWDAQCQSVAASVCTAADRVSAHGECTTGAGLPKYTTGCTARVQRTPAYSYCATSWDAACVAEANRACTGGLEAPTQALGFCGTVRAI